MSKRLNMWMVVAALVALALLAGCGGGSGSTNGSTEPSTDAASNKPPPGEPSKEFIAKKGDNTIAKFGAEGSVTELEAASAVLAANLKARQAGDFAGQCSSLGNAGLRSVVGEGKKQPTEAACSKALKALAEPLSGSKEIRQNPLKGSVAALRVKGDRGYALFHGADGKDYAMPMEREDGEWKVGAILTTEIG